MSCGCPNRPSSSPGTEKRCRWHLLQRPLPGSRWLVLPWTALAPRMARCGLSTTGWSVHSTGDFQENHGRRQHRCRRRPGDSRGDARRPIVGFPERKRVGAVQNRTAPTRFRPFAFSVCFPLCSSAPGFDPLATHARRPECHSGCGGDIEAVDAVAHRDPDGDVGSGDGAAGQPVALGA